MYKTKNDMPEATRIKVVELLNHRLADAIDLALNAKQAHWNVKGPDFIALHKLFDEIAESAEEYVDLLAERTIQLGGFAEGTSRTVAKRSSLKDYPLSIQDGHAHVEYLSDSLAEFGKLIRKSIDLADELKDKNTADIFTEISRGADQYLWFVEAHLQTAK